MAFWSGFRIRAVENFGSAFVNLKFLPEAAQNMLFHPNIVDRANEILVIYFCQLPVYSECIVNVLGS